MAFGLQIKRKAGLTNVLQRQKVIPKKPSFRTQQVLKISLLSALGLGICTTAGLFLFNFALKSNGNDASIQIQDYTIQFDGAFPDSVRENIYKKTNAIFIKNNSQFRSISTLAEEIQEKEGLSKVHIFMDFQNRLTISIAPRIPVMHIAGNSGKVISLDGEIYEDSNFIPKFQTVLSGVFQSEKQLYQIDKKNCVSTSEKEKKIVIDAISLVTQAEQNSLFLSSIEYKMYRGYFAKLQNLDTTVVFGYPPFESQFSRLSKILEESKKKNRPLSSIEVDYSDKAFIKESRL